MKLSQAAFQRAVRFLKTQARPLDRALFEFEFEGVARGGVLSELSKFQNPDGGFGHGLEPDYRLPASTPLATSVAFQFLTRIQAPEDHPLVVSGIRYFLSSFDSKRHLWQRLVLEMNDHPHAPWWTVDSKRLETLEENWANPSAEIVGYLHRFGAQGVPIEFVSSATDQALTRLAAEPVKMESHDLLAYLRLAELLPDSLRAKANEKLLLAVPATVDQDEGAWSGYGLRPSWVVQLADSPFASFIRPALDRNLDYEIRTQGEDGAWHPFWNWGSDPENWKIAERDWKGFLTASMLRTLRSFGRIES